MADYFNAKSINTKILGPVFASNDYVDEGLANHAVMLRAYWEGKSNVPASWAGDAPEGNVAQYGKQNWFQETSGEGAAWDKDNALGPRAEDPRRARPGPRLGLHLLADGGRRGRSDRQRPPRHEPALEPELEHWTDITKTGISLSAGQQLMRIAMVGPDFNVDWIEIRPR